MPGLLQAAEQHDLHEAADVQGRRGGIEADIAGHDLPARQRVERGGVRDLVDIAALGEEAQEVGSVFGHGARV